MGKSDKYLALLLLLIVSLSVKSRAGTADSIHRAVSVTMDIPAVVAGEVGLYAQYRLSDKFAFNLKAAMHRPLFSLTKYNGYSVQLGFKKYFKTSYGEKTLRYYTGASLLYKDLTYAANYYDSNVFAENIFESYNDYSWKKAYKLKIIFGKEIHRGSFVMDWFIGTGLGLYQVSSWEYYAYLNMDPEEINNYDFTGNKFLLYPSFHAGLLIGINFPQKKNQK